MRRHKDPSRRQPKRKTTQAQKTPATPTAATTATTATSTGALHPLCGGAPVTWWCTRYVVVHPNRRGALPTDRVQRPNKQEQTLNWHTEPLTATPLHAYLGPTGGGMGTPPTPPPALRPTPAHSDTSYTLKCEEPDNLSAKTKPIRERPDNKAIRASPHARDTPSNATRPFPHPATRKGPPPHEGTAGLVNESQDPWIVTDTSRVAPSRAIVRLMVSPAR